MLQCGERYVKGLRAHTTSIMAVQTTLSVMILVKSIDLSNPSPFLRFFVFRRCYFFVSWGEFELTVYRSAYESFQV